jgi:hypothetical protein
MKNLVLLKTVLLSVTLSVGSLLCTLPARADLRQPMTGTTQNEREIRWLWKYLGEFSLSCTSSATDCQTAELKAVALKLNDYLPAFDSPQATTWAGLLEFVSEKDHPGLFDSYSGEAHRVVATKLEKLAKVYINTDRMDLPLETWCGLLIHEVTHHLGYDDDATRLPDRVGTAIAQHFFKQVQSSNLGQFNAPMIRTAVFNSVALNHASVGVISWGDWTSDISWQSFPLQPICLPSEKMIQEFVSAPSWRVNRFRYNRGIVTIKGGGYVRGVCQSSSGTTRTSFIPLAAAVDLQYALPFDVKNWPSQTPTAIFDGVDFQPSNNPGDFLFGMAASFLPLSITHEKPKLQAGETWRTRLILRSTDSFAPTNCTLYVAGTQYAYLKQDGLPGVNPFDSCTITKLPNQQYQIDGVVRLPASTRPDFYYIPVVIMNDGVSDRSAVPVAPSFVEVVNSGAPPPPVIRKIELPGLAPAKSIGIDAVHDSFLVSPGQIFTLEFTVEGQQAATEGLWFDLEMWFPRPDQVFGVMAGTGSSISFPQVLLKTVVSPTSGGTRIVMTFRMPEQIAGQEIAALKFRRLYVRTTDYSWAEIELPDFHAQMAINPKWGQ